jgi:hypothetical protein
LGRIAIRVRLTCATLFVGNLERKLFLVSQGKSTDQLPVKTLPFDSSDCVVIVYGFDTANTSNNCSQTAIIPISRLFANIPNADPHSVGSLWSNAGILTISSG